MLFLNTSVLNPTSMSAIEGSAAACVGEVRKRLNSEIAPNKRAIFLIPNGNSTKSKRCLTRAHLFPSRRPRGFKVTRLRQVIACVSMVLDLDF